MVMDIFKETEVERAIRRLALQGLGLPRDDPAYPRNYQRVRLRVPRLTPQERQTIERRQRELEEMVLDMLKLRKT